VVNHADRVFSGVFSYDDLHILAGAEYMAWRGEGPERRMEDLVSRIKRLKSLSPETLREVAAKERNNLQATFGRDLQTAKQFLARIERNDLPPPEKCDMYLKALSNIANAEGVERAFKEAEKLLKQI